MTPTNMISENAPWAGFAVDVTLKVTLLFAVAALVTAVLRKNSAALRHLIWRLTFCGALLMPLCAALAPRWELPVLAHVAMQPAQRAKSSAPQPNVAAGIHDFDDRKRPEHPPARPTTLPHGSAHGRDELSSLELEFETSRETGFRPTKSTMPIPAEAATVEADANLFDSAPSRALWFAALWGMGFGFACWRIFDSAVRKRFLLRNTREIDDPESIALLHELGGKIGLHRAVQLLELPARVVPMTWGAFRPLVLLPETWVCWSRQRLQFVLLHELAHVKRLDSPCQLLSRIMTAVFWFHPLVWYGAKRIRIEREIACDDCVVNTGECVSDYAAELVDIATTYRPSHPLAAVAMARASQLEGRIRSLFDRSRSHRPLSRTFAAGLTVSAMLAVSFAAAANPVGRAGETFHAVETSDQPATATTKKTPRKTTDSLGDLLPKGAMLRLGTLRFRHPNSIVEMAVSPDGETVVTFGRHYLIVWDASTGKEKWRANPYKIDQNLPHASYGIRAAAFTPESKSFYACGPKGGVVMWDVATGRDKPLSIMPTNATTHNRQNRFRSIDVSPNGKWLALGSGDGLVVCDTTGKKLYEIVNRPAGLLEMGNSRDRLRFGGNFSMGRFSPDGKTLAVVTSDAPKTIRLHDAITGNEFQTIKLASRMVRMAFTPNGKQIVATERDQAVRLYDADSGREVWAHVLKMNSPYENYTSAVAISPDGKTIAAGATDNAIYLLNAATGQRVARMKGTGRYPWAVDFTADGKLLYSAGWDGPIRRWDVAAKKQLSLPKGIHADGKVAASPDGKRLAYCDDAGTIRLVSAFDNTEESTLRINGADFSQLLFSPSGRMLAAGGTQGNKVQVAVWNLADGKLFHHWKWAKGRDPYSQVEALSFTPDGKHLAAAVFRQSAAYIWNLSTARQVAQLKHRSIYGLSFSPDGKTLATAGWDKTVQFWETESGKFQRRHNMANIAGQAVDSRMYAVCYAPQGELLATAHMDSQIRVWHAKTMKLHAQFNIELDFAYGAMSFSPDGLWLATGSFQGKVTLWDPNTGTKLWDRGRHQGHVYTVGFGRDGRTLVSGGDDGVCYLWDLAPADAKPPNKKLPVSWANLAEHNGTIAYRAMWELSQDPDRAVSFLAGKLQPKNGKTDVKQIRQWIADLDSADFTKRNTSQAALLKLRSNEVGPLRAALAKPSSAEQRFRLKKILARIQPETATIRLRRAVSILYGIGTPKSLELLKQLALQNDNLALKRIAAATLR